VLTTATGKRIAISGRIHLGLVLGGVTVQPIWFLVTEALENDLIIGCDVLRSPSFGELHINRKYLVYHGNGRRQKIPLLTSRSRAHVETKKMTTAGKAKSALSAKAHERNLVGSIRAVGHHTIPPFGELILGDRSTRVKGMGAFRDTRIRYLKQALQSRYQPPALIVERCQSLRSAIAVVQTVCLASDDVLNGARSVPVHLANKTNQPIKVRDGEKLAYVEFVDSSNVAEINEVRSHGRAAGLKDAAGSQ
jgi:hypothetical protein